MTDHFAAIKTQVWDAYHAPDADAFKQKKVSEYKEKFANPYITAERGYVDDVIPPSETKIKLVNAFNLLRTKVDTNPKKKHGNIPL